MQFASGWLSPVIVFGAGRRPRKTPVVFRQILFSQVLVRRFVARDLLPSHFLDQPILMHSVGAFYAPLGLGRTGRNDADAQFFTHTSELCERHFPPQLLGWRGLGACTRSSNRYRAHAARHGSRSRPAAHPPPPRSSLPCPFALRNGLWHHPPCPSGSPAGRALQTNHGNCHPAAPVRQNGLCAPAVSNASYAFAADSTALLPASTAAAFRGPPRCRLLRLNARRPMSDRTSPPPHPNTSCGLNSTPDAALSMACDDSTADPRCHALALRCPAR